MHPDLTGYLPLPLVGWSAAAVGGLLLILKGTLDLVQSLQTISDVKHSLLIFCSTWSGVEVAK